MCPIQADLKDIQNLTKASLSYALVHFIQEITKLDGTDYPPKTLYEIVIGVQMILEAQGLYWKLLDNTEPLFANIKYTLDNTMDWEL